MKILIIDDKEENLYLLESRLKGNGYMGQGYYYSPPLPADEAVKMLATSGPFHEKE